MTRPEMRGRGLMRPLVAAGFGEAREAGASHCITDWRTASLPINAFGFDHDTFSMRAAEWASHSFSATTATNSLIRTTRAAGTALMDVSSMLISLAPTEPGRMTRACNIPSILKS